MADDANNSGGKTHEESVPFARFEQVRIERNALREEVAGFSALKERAASVDTLTAQIEALKADHAAQVASWDTTRVLMEAGVMDPEGREVATFLHSRLPEGERPPIGEWLSSFQGENATGIPKALAPYLGGTATVAAPAIAEVTPQTPPATETTKSRVSTDAGVTTTTTPTTPQWSTERIRELRLEAQRTNDWSKYKEARDSILEATSKRR